LVGTVALHIPFPSLPPFPVYFLSFASYVLSRPSVFLSPLSSLPPPFVSVRISQLSISPHFPFMCTLFPHPSTFRSLSRSGALNPVSRSWERCNLPQWGLGRRHRLNRFFLRILIVWLIFAISLLFFVWELSVQISCF